MSTFNTICSKQTHKGRALECFGFVENEDGGATLMRWVQTPYRELAIVPELFDLSEEEWRALREKSAIVEHPLPALLAETEEG